MTFRHAFVSLAALVGLAACSDEDTIVSLNVAASDSVPVVDTLRVTVAQGSKQHVSEFAPPIETPTAPEGEEAPSPSIKNNFFQRITLPGDWSESEATLTVEALQASGVSYNPPFSDETVAVIQPENVVAAYVRLDAPPEPPPSEGGAGGASNGGTSGESAGAGGDVGVGGAPAAGAGG